MYSGISLQELSGAQGVGVVKGWLGSRIVPGLRTVTKVAFNFREGFNGCMVGRVVGSWRVLKESVQGTRVYQEEGYAG